MEPDPSADLGPDAHYTDAPSPALCRGGGPKKRKASSQGTPVTEARMFARVFLEKNIQRHVVL